MHTLRLQRQVLESLISYCAFNIRWTGTEMHQRMYSFASTVSTSKKRPMCCLGEPKANMVFFSTPRICQPERVHLLIRYLVHYASWKSLNFGWGSLNADSVSLVWCLCQYWECLDQRVLWQNAKHCDLDLKERHFAARQWHSAGRHIIPARQLRQFGVWRNCWQVFYAGQLEHRDREIQHRRSSVWIQPIVDPACWSFACSVHELSYTSYIRYAISNICRRILKTHFERFWNWIK